MRRPIARIGRARLCHWHSKQLSLWRRPMTLSATPALAVAYHRLFTTGAIQYLDPKLFNNLDGGILGILPSTSKDTFQPLPTADPTAAVANVLLLDPSQIVIVLPKTPINPPPSPGPFYENLLYGLAESIGRLQRRYYNDHYVNVSSTSVFSQYFVPLQGALQQPIEPASQLMTVSLALVICAHIQR